MTSDRTLRWSAFVFAVLFGVVIGLGYLPGANAGHEHVSMGSTGEHSMFGLYMIGTADDVTHGLTTLLLLIAAAVSGAWSRVGLTAFGWYYSFDAAIYLVTGIIQGNPVMSTIMLNLPHVVISGTMLWLAYRGRGLRA
jgi:hypothetical protein